MAEKLIFLIGTMLIMTHPISSDYGVAAVLLREQTKVSMSVSCLVAPKQQMVSCDSQKHQASGVFVRVSKTQAKTGRNRDAPSF